MKADEWTSEDVHIPRGGEFPPCAGLSSNALPEAQSTVSAESSQTGMSTRNVHILSKPIVQKEEEISHWYALRTIYGREKKAYDYMTAKVVTAFYPTTEAVKLIKGKRKIVTESCLPNILFTYGNVERLKTPVCDNVNLPLLHFYYRHVHVGRRIEKTPMMVPDCQMESLEIICASDADHTIVSLVEVPKFEKGQLVKVIDDVFKVMVGRDAHWQGQQRAGAVVDDLVTIATAYIPGALLQKNIIKQSINMKYALITGASRGIGRAVALRLANEYPVIINYHSNSESANEVKKLIEANGGYAELLPFDVADSQSIEKAIDLWEQKHPDDYISVLINNAGIRRDNVMFMMANEEWHDVVNTNLNGFFYITRRLLKHMMPRKRGGRIINMSSLSGLKGMVGQVNYSTAKAALIGATKALAQEVAPRNITVNAVAPGFIQTDMTKDLPQDELKKLVPVGRFGKPEEVAALVGFLVSDDAAYITGEVISINGGLYT